MQSNDSRDLINQGCGRKNRHQTRNLKWRSWTENGLCRCWINWMVKKQKQKHWGKPEITTRRIYHPYLWGNKGEKKWDYHTIDYQEWYCRTEEIRTLRSRCESAAAGTGRGYKEMGARRTRRIRRLESPAASEVKSGDGGSGDINRSTWKRGDSLHFVYLVIL